MNNDELKVLKKDYKLYYFFADFYVLLVGLLLATFILSVSRNDIFDMILTLLVGVLAYVFAQEARKKSLRILLMLGDLE